LDRERPYFAHSTSRPDRADWQPLCAHLREVACLARAHAAKFGAGDWGYIAGLLHDLGKYSAEFQRYLEGGPGGVDHSTAGARIAVERFGPQIGKLMAFCVAGHHAGLADGVGGTNRSALEDRLDLNRVIPNINAAAWNAEILLPNRLEAPQLSPAPAPFSGFDVPFFTRMLFSCLIDADRTNTRDFDLRSKGITPEERDRPSLAELRERLDTHFVRLHEDLARRNRADAPINLRRAEILTHARAHARADQGVFTLTVPTGGGKTLTSLAFALDHALAQREPLDRIIYVIPFTSIIEQTADVFRGALQTDDPAVVLEHHSAFDLEERKARDNRDEERRDGSEPIRLAMETWDSRIVVTTAVQFFESLFADRTTRCRKLHNIARSVVILDEAQTLPLPLLLPCIAALQELGRNYRTSIVLCTATQPALKKRADFPGGFENPPEIAPKGLDAEPVFQRVQIEVAGRLSDDDLAERLGAEPQVLCIVNNRAHARALFDRIKGAPGARHLSTLMCAKHRSAVLDEIRAALDPKARRPCRVVSTSLVEAGVDIDFPVVYRAEAGLDSIAQAAGRCNREGRDPKGGRVVVFRPDDAWKPPRELQQFTSVGSDILAEFRDDPLSFLAIEAYFSDVYWSRNQSNDLDAKRILNLIEETTDDRSYPFESIASLFHMIKDNDWPLIVPYRGSGGTDTTVDDVVAKLRMFEVAGRRLIHGAQIRTRDLARWVQPYLAMVPQDGFRQLRIAGAVEAINPAVFGEQFWRLANEALYDPNVGIGWQDPYAVDPERLIISE
jgi:CRISPR-associated endonuclease/helicase Cas3